jgi:hypothetical protein
MGVKVAVPVAVGGTAVKVPVAAGSVPVSNIWECSGVEAEQALTKMKRKIAGRA